MALELLLKAFWAGELHEFVNETRPQPSVDVYPPTETKNSGCASLPAVAGIVNKTKCMWAIKFVHEICQRFFNLQLRARMRCRF